MKFTLIVVFCFFAGILSVPLAQDEDLANKLDSLFDEFEADQPEIETSKDEEVVADKKEDSEQVADKKADVKTKADTKSDKKPVADKKADVKAEAKPASDKKADKKVEAKPVADKKYQLFVIITN